MKRFLSFCICTFVTVIALWAQDIIVTNDAKKIEAKILEVSKSEIKYKEKGNLNGPTFVLETKEISSVIYANGKVVLYNQQASVTPKEDQATTATTTENQRTLTPGVDYNVEIWLMNGQVVKGKLMELAKTYVAYTLDGKYNTIPASQVEYVKDLRNGEITKYLGLSSDSKSTGSQKTTPKYVSRNGNTYYYDGKAMNEDAYSTFLHDNCPTAYDKFYSGRNIAFAGWILFSVGVGFDIGSLIGYVIAGSTPANTAFSIIGLSCEIACIPTLIVGYNKKHKSADVYNSSCAHKSVKAYWSINASQNGLGIAYNF